MTESDYDAADIMLFGRGAHLRKLRELEAQDEAERSAAAAAAAAEAASAKEESNHNSSNNNIIMTIDKNDNDTLQYESHFLLAGQQYYDDYKHVNYRFIDFGYVRKSLLLQEDLSGCDSDHEKHQQHQQQLPLIIEQDRSLRSKGGMVWDAGFILAEHVIHEHEEWKKPTGRNHKCHTNNNTMQHPSLVTMVELGAGTGITGLMVASALPNDVHMSLTDLPLLMPLLQKNLERNQSPCLHATAFPLAWGNHVKGHYDVILGADVVAGIYDPIKLAQTMADLCHDRTIVYLAVNSRLTEIIATFETALHQHFERIERRVPVSRNKNPNVSILVATGRRLYQ